MKKFDSSRPLSPENPEALFPLGEMLACYRLNTTTRAVEFLPIPAGKRDRLVERRVKHPSHPFFEGEDSVDFVPENQTDSLVQTAIRHLKAPDMWRAGESMRNGEATESLEFLEQRIERGNDVARIETMLRSEHGFEVRHTVEHPEGAPGLLVRTDDP